jgi:prevent-host-death family protein
MTIFYITLEGIMKAPKTVPATEFKAHCLALLEEVRETRQSLLVTRHGKPVVEISPYVPKDRGRVNPLKGSILFQDDLISTETEYRGLALGQTCSREAQD